MDKMHTNYRLKGVVVHTGTSEGGHYYSLIKT
jgi:ubiquitin C-terminal hydrolase